MLLDVLAVVQIHEHRRILEDPDEQRNLVGTAIETEMLDLLRKRGAKAIEAVGTDFDPRIHESVMLESSEAHREGEVIAEFRRGYMLGERLLRPSMVKVAKA